VIGLHRRHDPPRTEQRNVLGADAVVLDAEAPVARAVRVVTLS